MLSFHFDPFPVLVTERLVLREIKLADAEDVFFLRSDAEILKYINRDPCASMEEAVAFIQLILGNREANLGVSWSLTPKGSDEMIGSIAFWRLMAEHHRAEIGYTMKPAYHKRGLMQEAMEAVLDYGFNVMNLHTIEANINPSNDASRKLLERNGFVQEAYYKESYFYDGVFSDSAGYTRFR